MTLISILIGLGLEYYFGALDRIRNLRWFDQYCRWLELKCSDYGFWDGPAGVLLTLALPLTIITLLGYVVSENSITLGFILATAVFIYSLGPEFNTMLGQYIAVLEINNASAVSETEEKLFGFSRTSEQDKEKIIDAILYRAHEYIFGVIFWFIILGMLGALLYCLVVRMQQKHGDVHGEYADAVRHLHNILMWPSARLLAAGFALSGSLVDAMEGWRTVEGDSLEVSHAVIGLCGLGAMQYRNESDAVEGEQHQLFIDWVHETQALINRSLVVWLTILGIMTIGGWLA